MPYMASLQIDSCTLCQHPPTKTLRHPKYHLIETIGPLAEVDLGGLDLEDCFPELLPATRSAIQDFHCHLTLCIIFVEVLQTRAALRPHNSI